MANKHMKKGWARWLTPLMLGRLEIRRIPVQDQPRQIVPETPSPK
jgi:hypothetical protein